MDLPYNSPGQERRCIIKKGRNELRPYKNHLELCPMRVSHPPLAGRASHWGQAYCWNDWR